MISEKLKAILISEINKVNVNALLEHEVAFAKQYGKANVKLTVQASDDRVDKMTRSNAIHLIGATANLTKAVVQPNLHKLGNVFATEKNETGRLGCFTKIVSKTSYVFVESPNSYAEDVKFETFYTLEKFKSASQNSAIYNLAKVIDSDYVVKLIDAINRLKLSANQVKINLDDVKTNFDKLKANNEELCRNIK